MDDKSLIIDIENNMPYMAFRPKDCPKVIVRVYDVDKIDLQTMKWGVKKTDDKGREYIEAVWGE